MIDRRLVLSEEDSDVLDIVEPEEATLVLDTPVEDVVVAEEPNVEPDVVTNAYTDMLQDLLRKQWDVINSADGIIATLSQEESGAVNKEDIKAILSKLVDDTTVAIGMVTKALGVVDPSQEELMNQGVEKAEGVISKDVPSPDGVIFDLSDGSGEPEEVLVKDGEVTPVEENVKPLNEDASDWRAVDFSGDDYYDRFWEEECFYQLQYFWENMEDYSDEEDIQELDNLSTEDIEEIVRDAASEVRDSDYLWEEINERIQDEVRDALSRKLDELRNTPTVEIELGKPEGE